MKISINDLIARALLGVILAAIVLAGCGDGSEGETFKGEPAAAPTQDSSKFKPGMPPPKK